MRLLEFYWDENVTLGVGPYKNRQNKKQDLHNKVRMMPVKDKMWESQLTWFGQKETNGRTYEVSGWNGEKVLA